MKHTAGFVWNMIGSACYSISSILYLMVVTRICGATVGGFFSLSYATAQLLLSIGRYGMRTYQATDLQSQYSYYEYIFSRIITVSVMLILGIVYSVFSFEHEYIIMSVLVIALKSLDAIEDVYHGRLQQTYHVEQMGKSQAFRNVYTALCFAIALVLTRNLLVTLNITVITSFVLCILVNQYVVKKYAYPSTGNKYVSLQNILDLLKSCTGIFVGTFLSLLLYNIPKYAMAGLLEAEYQTYYSILFMPAFVVTLLCEFVFKPIITSIAGLWFSGNKKQFNKTIIVCLTIISACGIFVALAGHLLGRRILEILYHVDLSPYKLHFVVLLLGGGIGACVYMIYNVLIAIRHGKSIKTVYGFVTTLSVIIVKPMIVKWGMLGAALNYFVCELALLVFFSIILSYLCCHHK